MSSPLLNLVISDTHCGSDVGLLPPEVFLDDGHNVGYGRNRRQEFLWKSWEDMQKRFSDMAGKDPYILTLNGDLIEGIHHRSDEVVAAKMAEHLTIARVALAPLVNRAKKVIVTKGTQCHTGDWELVFCKEFGLEPAKDVQQYTVHGCMVDARHHMPTTSRKHLEAGMLSIVMADTISQMVRARHPVPGVFLRAHRHTPGDYCDMENAICVTGAWQYLTRYGHNKVTGAIPRFASYVLDWREEEYGALPVRRFFKYDPPHEVLHS